MQANLFNSEQYDSVVSHIETIVSVWRLSRYPSKKENNGPVVFFGGKKNVKNYLWSTTSKRTTILYS